MDTDVESTHKFQCNTVDSNGMTINNKVVCISKLSIKDN